MDAKTLAILEELEPLKQRARETDCVLHCCNMMVDHWMTPDQMDEANKEGRFIWSACNWRLVPRAEMLKRYEDKYAQEKAALDSVRRTLGGRNAQP